MVRWNTKSKLLEKTNLYKFIDKKDNYKHFFSPIIDKKKSDVVTLNNNNMCNINNTDNINIATLNNNIETLYNKYYCY